MGGTWEVFKYNLGKKQTLLLIYINILLYDFKAYSKRVCIVVPISSQHFEFSDLRCGANVFSYTWT